jgi:hypothetical protein
MNRVNRARGPRGSYWNLNRETTLNWLALGMLLAAWNASDNEPRAPTRPEALRGYAHVSVRSVRQASVTEM